MSSGLNIQDWIQGLCALPEEAPPARITQYIRTHLVCLDSLGPYTHYREKHYTRNLIFKDARFEVLTLCWEPGQVSSVHNHRDQECWVAMADGQLENICYRVVQRDAAAGTCELEPSGTSLITREQPMGIDGGDSIHQIVNCPSCNRRALSLHVYSKPFDTCEIYDLEAGTYRDIKLSYYTEFGKLVERASA